MRAHLADARGGEARVSGGNAPEEDVDEEAEEAGAASLALSLLAGGDIQDSTTGPTPCSQARRWC